mgnify:CR=1 FL=1
MKQFKNEYRDQFNIKKPKKKKNEKNRTRSHIYNFHVTEEELEMILHRVEVTGMTRREFMLNSCLGNEITAIGNIKTFNKIQSTLDEVISRLDSLSPADELDEVMLQKIQNIVDVYAGLKK